MSIALFLVVMVVQGLLMVGNSVFTGSFAQNVEVSNCVLAKAGNGIIPGQAINDNNPQANTALGGASIFGNVAYNIPGPTYYTVHNVANNPTSFEAF